MEKEEINRVIELLEKLLSHPLAFPIDNPELTESFLAGFQRAIFLFFDLFIPYINARKHIMIKRGHKFTALSTRKELEKEGYSHEQIIKELILVEIETWKILRDN